MSVKKPNLFVIGAQKAGTTTLHRYLSGHPEIFMSEPKEPGFFVPELSYYPKEESWYLGLFADAADASVIGESSTHYTKLPVHRGVPERIADFAPDARFIYIVRDPVDRALSHYWHRVSKHTERHKPLDAMKKDITYVAFGDYAMQIKPYWDLFGKDRTLILEFEEFVANPQAVVQRVFQWLGVDPAFSTSAPIKENVRPESIRRIQGSGMLSAVARSRALAPIIARCPPPLRRIARSFVAKPVNPADEDMTPVIAYLQDELTGKAEHFAATTGLRFAWPSVFNDHSQYRRNDKS